MSDNTDKERTNDLVIKLIDDIFNLKFKEGKDNEDIESILKNKYYRDSKSDKVLPLKVSIDYWDFWLTLEFTSKEFESKGKYCITIDQCTYIYFSNDFKHSLRKFNDLVDNLFIYEKEIRFFSRLSKDSLFSHLLSLEFGIKRDLLNLFFDESENDCWYNK